MENRRQGSIVLCRDFSMILIILCHIIRRYEFIPGHTILGQIFDVGVYSFLAISGYLYGGKQIDDFKAYMKKRLKVIAIPALITILIAFIVKLVQGESIGLMTVLIYMCNLQGLLFLCSDFSKIFQEIDIIGPLWFITIILICYLIVPLLQKVRSIANKKDNSKYFFAFIFLLSLALSYFIAVKFNFILFYFITFSAGYFIADKEIKINNKNIVIFLNTAFMIVMQVLRLVLRHLYDGESLYTAFTYASHVVLGIWILNMFLMAEVWFPTFIEKVSSLKLFVFLDSISFYVYMIHCFFCRGAFNVYEHIENLFIATIVFFSLTFISAFILKKITKFVNYLIKN